MLFYIACLLCIVAILTLVARPYWGILITLAANPIIAASWQTRIGNVSLNHVIGSAVPLLILPRVLGTNVEHPKWRKWRLICLLFVVANGLGVLTLLATGNKYAALETTVHTANCFVAFSMFAIFYRSDEGVQHLVIALLIGGLFPIAVGLYQAATGVVWQERYSAGIARNVGLYHDAVSIKHFGLQTLLGIYLAFYCFEPTTIKKYAWAIYGGCCLFVIFNAFSKSALAILCVWFLIWALLNNRFVGGALILACTAGINFATNNYLIDSVRQLFWKEIAFNRGELESKYLLAGRVSVWDELIHDWVTLPLVSKLIGTGEPFPAHNELLRILVSSGIIGAVAFAIASFLVLGMVADMVLRVRRPLQLVAAFAFTMWLIDCIGIHPGVYSYFMWCVWGLIGLTVAATPVTAPSLDDYRNFRFQPFHRGRVPVE